MLAQQIEPLIHKIFDTLDWARREWLYNELLDLCAECVFTQGLARRGKYWSAKLWEAIEGQLKEFPARGWIGIEYRYGSQFALGGDVRKLFG